MLAFAPLAAGPLATANVASGAFVAIPSVGISVAGIAPDLVGRGLRVFPPAANVVVSVVAPTAVTGALVKVENAQVTLIKRAPRYVGPNFIVRPNVLGSFTTSWLRPRILTGVFSERRIKFVTLRQTGAS